MPTRNSTIDEYLAALDPKPRAALERLRRQIRGAAPRSVECISYGIPAVRLDGRMLVAFGAAKRHCSFFPGSLPLQQHRAALAKFATAKGTVRFTPENPLPAALVRQLVKTRVAQYAAKVDTSAKASSRRHSAASEAKK